MSRHRWWRVHQTQQSTIYSIQTIIHTFLPLSSVCEPFAGFSVRFNSSEWHVCTVASVRKSFMMARIRIAWTSHFRGVVDEMTIYCPRSGLLCRWTLNAMFVRCPSVLSVSRSFLSAQVHFKKLNHFLGHWNRLTLKHFARCFRFELLLGEHNPKTDQNPTHLAKCLKGSSGSSSYFFFCNTKKNIFIFLSSFRSNFFLTQYFWLKFWGSSKLIMKRSNPGFRSIR